MPSFAWTTVLLGPPTRTGAVVPFTLGGHGTRRAPGRCRFPARPSDRRADVARWRRVGLRTVVADCRRADARVNVRRFVDLLAARADWDNLTVGLTLADAAATLGVSERTVTSIYPRFFRAGLLVERVPPRSAAAGPDGQRRPQARVCRLWLPRDAGPNYASCAVCEAVGESVAPRPVPLHTACCDACWIGRWQRPRTTRSPPIADPHSAVASAEPT
jgi:hypothetical protein